MQTTLRGGRARIASDEAADRRPGQPRWGRLGRADRRALLVLVVAPLVAFVLPALVGHPLLLGDDLTQNEPLRILVGAELRAGHLPLFDPYLWSGAPLLAGWNAGAAYPLTWLFAVLPGALAWTVGLVVTWWVAAGSLYGLCRNARLSVLGSLLGALAFAWSGAFLAQIVHFGLVAGMSWVPLQLLAVDRLAEASEAQGRLWWAAVLGAAVGATVLAGEPRAIDDMGIALFCYLVWRVARHRPGRLRLLAWVVGAALVGVALGAVQWLPGLEAVAGSQRASASVSLFGAGSLPDRWLALLLVPDLLGGSGSLRQPAFLAGYSLTEVAGYVGALPLVGGLALLGRLRRAQPAPPWLFWQLLAVVGVVLSLGINTPVGHLLARVPFYGAQRLQSRNLVVADLALAVLTGYVVDELCGQRTGARPWAGQRRVAALAGVGAALVAVPVVLLSTWGDGFLRALRVGAPSPGAAAAILPSAVPFAVFGLLAAAVVWLGPRLAAQRRRRALGLLAAANLLAFALLVVVAVPPASPPPPPVRLARPVARGTAAPRGAPAVATSAPAPARHLAARPAVVVPPSSPARPVGALGLGGRFAIYDPDLLEGAQLTILGTPDANAVTRTPSVLGYGSIVNARYARRTGSHGVSGSGQDVLAPAAAADGVLDQLDTRALLTLPPYLVTPTAGGGPAPGRGTGVRRLAGGRPVTWELGEPLALASLSVPLRAAPRPAAPGREARARVLRLGLVAPSGRTRWWPAPAGAGVALVRLGRPFVAVAVRAEGMPGAWLGPPRLTTAAGASLVADGQLEGVLVPPRWRYDGRDGAFAVFVDQLAAPPLRLAPLPGRRLGRARLSQVGGPPSAPDVVRVAAPHGALVVRSVSALAGWRASWQSGGAPRTTPLVVRRHGLVQEVVVPPGQGVLRFTYDPPGFVPGAVLSLVGLAALAALLMASWRRRPGSTSRRRHPSRGSRS